MSILISPNNNTGWGMGTKVMYGGAKMLSEQHPVRVSQHYRAAWGSKKGRTPKTRVAMTITDDPVADVVNAIERDRLRKRRQRRARHLVRRARSRLSTRMRITDDPVADVVNAVAAATARRRSRRRAHTQSRRRSARLQAQNARRNVYWVRNADGVRVPVFSRPRP